MSYLTAVTYRYNLAAALSADTLRILALPTPEVAHPRHKTTEMTWTTCQYFRTMLQVFDAMKKHILI